MKTTNTTYEKTETSKFKVTRIDGIIDGPDYFDSKEDVEEFLKEEKNFNTDTDNDSFSIEEL